MAIGLRNVRRTAPQTAVLGMTHEEAAVQLVREYGRSYLKYPFMIYQLQTKFRDEARARGGLIHVREFTMKDAYSFHTSQDDLNAYYQRCHQAYRRIFTRVGVPEVISVTADSGMMGGSVSHEFMLLTPIGEDSIVLCPSCGTSANLEALHPAAPDISEASDTGDFAKTVEGSACPHCGRHGLTIQRGIEVGNIFQLGTKYTKSMGMTYQDENGKERFPVMGCYGIGLGRLAASICEVRHDDYGPIWPMSIAPWQVHLCAVRADNPEVQAAADRLYEELQAARCQVLYDDRPVSAGVLFSDADLLGVPLRVIVSPRSLKKGCCELVSRDKRISREAPLSCASLEILKTVEEWSFL